MDPLVILEDIFTMRRFLINRKTVTAGAPEIINLGFGCEMWDQGPVAVVDTVPPYQARWFLNLDSLKKARFYLPRTGELVEGQWASIDLLMVDDQELNYWTMLASKFGVSTEEIAPALELFLSFSANINLSASNTTGSTSERKDPCLVSKPALMKNIDMPLVHSEAAH
jgi:hypothetical protein